MALFALDTSCMIAAVCEWHEHHAAAVAEIERRLSRGRPLVPAPALVEAFAVLTRLPAPHRLSPSDAWTLLKTNFVTRARTATLTSAAYRRLLARLANENIGGGRVYDAVIADCARRAGVGVLLTFNRKHFEPAPEGLAIVEP